jgi:mono/diheme cytochrome c family protein
MKKKRSSFGRRLGIFVLFVAVIGVGVLAYYATRPGAFAFAGGNRVALDQYKDGQPTGVPSDFKDTDPVARGRYLAEAADCRSCHTAEGGAPFAGGRPFKLPFGTLYTTNITPDKTGIGEWTDAEFLDALHNGIGRRGGRLYPAMPYASYAYMTDADVLAIKAYLMTVPAVARERTPNTLKFPYNQRWLMAIWSALFKPGDRFQAIADKSAEWNRGAYLVEAMAHCGDCHTPRNLLQAPNNSKKFAGGDAEGWVAYNITSDKTSGVGGWSDEELAQYLATGHAQGRGTGSGPMGEAIALSFSKMTPGDIRAMVAYVRTVPAIATPELPAPKDAPASADPKQGIAANVDVRGQHVFAGACAGCHSWTGTSPLSSRATLTGTRAINDPSAKNVALIVLGGSKHPVPGAGLAMPSFGAAYSDDEIAAVANYVTGRFGAQASAITAADVQKMREMQ